MIAKCKLLFLFFLFFIFTIGAVNAEEEFKFHLQPKRAPLSSFEDENHSVVRLSNFRDKTIILNIWATYCVPCVLELQSLEQLSKDMGGRIEVIAVSVGPDDSKQIKNFFNKYNIKHLNIYTDKRRAIPTELGITSVPFTLLINSAGAEIARIVGKAEFDTPTIKAQIKNLLRKF